MRVKDFINGLSEADKVRFKELIEKAKKLEEGLDMASIDINMPYTLKTNLRELRENMMTLLKKVAQLRTVTNKISKIRDNAKYDNLLMNLPDDRFGKA